MSISNEMYEKCLIDDKKEYWENITEDIHLYLYCVFVKDRPEIYNRIKGSYTLYRYCKDLINRPELAEKITDEFYINKISE